MYDYLNYKSRGMKYNYIGSIQIKKIRDTKLDSIKSPYLSFGSSTTGNRETSLNVQETNIQKCMEES